MPEKIIGLTLILDFFDRCHSLASLDPAPGGGRLAPPLRYRGYYYDTETGFYYLQSRYYDPVTHRFINADSLTSTGAGILGYNMFAYCNNNPIMCSDSEGARPEWEDGHNGLYTDSGTGSSSDYNLSNTPLRDVTDEVDTALSQAVAEAEDFQARVNGMLGTPSGTTLILGRFCNQVNHYKPWDIKRLDPWEETIGTPYPGENAIVIYHDMEMPLDKLGNFTYGYLGAAYGIPLGYLIGGSYFAARFPTGGDELSDELVDWEYIQMGYISYSK